MSPSKLNSLLTGVFVAICVAVSGSVMAQDGLRLWKPYDSQSFSGGRRSNDGMYSSLSAIYWSISTPKDGYIGATTANGKDDIRMVFDVTSGEYRTQTNSLKANMMSPTTTLGYRFEVGNRRGHHGWLVSGYGLPGQSHSMYAKNASVVIRDNGNFSYYDSETSSMQSGGFLWKPIVPPTWTPTTWDPVKWIDGDWQYPDGRIFGTTAPFGYVSNFPSAVPDLPPGPDGYTWRQPVIGETVFVQDLSVISNDSSMAPAPVTFLDLNVNVRSQHMSAEVMYTYRAHPFTWGSMELLAGARYWDLEDKFGLIGRNYDNQGDEAHSHVYALLGMSVDAKANNHVVGPQVGMKLSRQNARWTFGADGRLTAGINTQQVRTSGYFLPFTGMDASVLGLQYTNRNFGHSQTKAYFSPIVEGQVSADWQWTQAVSFFGAVNGMLAGNIARGVRITDYVVHSDGTIFGIRGNDRNTSIAVYGVEAGIKVNR